MRRVLKPPGDVVKLSDRLYYLLQPPLETLLSPASRWRFPIKPFEYQFEGIAFLYTRTTAILADEMGLGKTMQAIATVRLLIHTGEVGTVLLVCPKPLVSNWVREFRLVGARGARGGDRRATRARREVDVAACPRCR